jgi:hypothetical protein
LAIRVLGRVRQVGVDACPAVWAIVANHAVSEVAGAATLLNLEIVCAAIGNDVLITGPTPHGVIVGAAVLSVGITVEYLSVAFRATVTPEIPLAIVTPPRLAYAFPTPKGKPQP